MKIHGDSEKIVVEATEVKAETVGRVRMEIQVNKEG